MKLKYSSLLEKAIYSFIICMSTFSIISAGENRISTADILKIEEQRLSEIPKNVIEQLIPKMSYSNDASYLNRINKLAYTFAVTSIDAGQKLQLIDESIWAINPVQRYQTKKWTQEHTIFIKPNASCFSRYPYVLYNRDTSEAVEVQFVSMPTTFNFYRQKISKIDPVNHVVELDDAERTVWQISLSDTGFNYWSEGDYIIVGVNNDWRIANNPHILINTSITQAPYCEAEFIGNGL